MQTKNQLSWIGMAAKRSVFTLLAFYLLMKCADPVVELTSTEAPVGLSSETGRLPSALDSLTLSSPCEACKYTVPPNVNGTNIDGLKLKLKPGDWICLQGGVKYGPLRFVNIEGTDEDPIVIASCNGKATVEAVDNEYSIKVLQSHHFRITGDQNGRGILLRGGKLGLTLDYLTTNFEIDHIEVAQVGFAGIMAKTDPTCDESTTRDHFVMRSVSIHDNFIHATGGEGIYVGNSFYGSGVKQPCGIQMPHAIEDVRIYNNLVMFAGWDGIQLGSAVKGAAIYNNDIKFFGTAGKYAQNSAIQIGEGTGGLCFNNLIKNGTGNGVTMLGLGDNLVSGNVIIEAGGAGIFCDDRYTPGPAFRFIDNIIINPKQEGIRLYSMRVKSVVNGNLIINPSKSPPNHDVPSSNDFVFMRNKKVRVSQSNNTFTRNISEVRDLYEAAFRFEAIDQNNVGTADINIQTRQPSGLSPLKIRELLKGIKVPLDL